MAAPSWDDSQGINVRDLDGQHRMLATLIRDLHDVMRYARSPETISGVFDEVVEYTKYHFAAEERLMRDTDFPGYLLHKAIHDNMKSRLVELRDRFERGGRPAISVAVFQFLRDWLVSHIEVDDQEIAEHLLNGGAPCTPPGSSLAGAPAPRSASSRSVH